MNVIDSDDESGAINEKKRRFFHSNGDPKEIARDDESRGAGYNPSTYLSHVLHSLEGLDRYPNYLNRWQLTDVEKLEDSLEEKLRLVRQQKKNVQERREQITALLKRVDMNEFPLLKEPRNWDEVRDRIMDPRASDSLLSQFFKRKGGNGSNVPSVENVIRGEVPVELDQSRLEDWMDQEMFDVYSFPLLSSEFCSQLKGFIRHVTALGKSEEYSHLELGTRAVDLDTVGIGWLNSLILHLVMRPLARQLFKDTEELVEDLDWRHGYVNAYVSSIIPGTNQRRRLVPHTDDAEVTINVFITPENEVKGGNLRFWGLRGTDEQGEFVGEYEPEVGRALLHAGRHFHEVTDIEEGNRYSYIMWARSWGGIRSSTCPCCWLNRRQDKDCICGPSWN